MINLWNLTDFNTFQNISSLRIFFWAIVHSDVSRCYFYIKGFCLKIRFQDDWNYQRSCSQKAIFIYCFLPQISLFIPDSLISEFGKIELGDEYFYIPF